MNFWKKSVDQNLNFFPLQICTEKFIENSKSTSKPFRMKSFDIPKAPFGIPNTCRMKICQMTRNPNTFRILPSHSVQFQVTSKLKLSLTWKLYVREIVSFYGRKFSFTATRQYDRKMIQFMPANHSNTFRVITIQINSDKTLFQNVFVTLLSRVAKDMTSSLLSWHKRYAFNTAIFRRHNQWNCALPTLWIRIRVYYSSKLVGTILYMIIVIYMLMYALLYVKQQENLFKN